MAKKFLQGLIGTMLLSRESDSDDKNPFKRLSYIQFTLLSIVFFISFPISLLIALVVLKPVGTKHLLMAFLQDFLQTLLIIVVVTIFVGWYIFKWLWQTLSVLLM